MQFTPGLITLDETDQVIIELPQYQTPVKWMFYKSHIRGDFLNSLLNTILEQDSTAEIITLDHPDVIPTAIGILYVILYQHGNFIPYLSHLKSTLDDPKILSQIHRSSRYLLISEFELIIIKLILIKLIIIEMFYKTKEEPLFTKDKYKNHLSDISFSLKGYEACMICLFFIIIFPFGITLHGNVKHLPIPMRIDNYVINQGIEHNAIVYTSIIWLKYNISGIENTCSGIISMSKTRINETEERLLYPIGSYTNRYGPTGDICSLASPYETTFHTICLYILIGVCLIILIMICYCYIPQYLYKDKIQQKIDILEKVTIE